jgi:hypothetical protein
MTFAQSASSSDATRLATAASLLNAFSTLLSGLRYSLFPVESSPNWGAEDIREIIMGEYRIVYRVNGEMTELITVFRSSRLFPTALPGV